MKSIFNSLLLCHVLESSISYILGYQGFNENYDENSQGIEMQFMGIENNKMNSEYGSSESDTCHESRKQCRCQKCYTIKNNCCEKYCKKKCGHDNDYQSYDMPFQMTPGVVVMPYPVPVMVIVNTTTVATPSTATSTSATTSTTTKGTTTKATITKATTTEATTTKATTTKATTTNAKTKTEPSKTTTSTEVTNEDSDYEMRNTVPPKRDRRSEVFMDYDMPNNENNKRFKIMTKKSYRRNINNPELKVKSLPKYGLVNIPEVLKSMIHLLKEERKVLLQEKLKKNSSYRNKRAVAGDYNRF